MVNTKPVSKTKKTVSKKTSSKIKIKNPKLFFKESYKASQEIIEEYNKSKVIGNKQSFFKKVDQKFNGLKKHINFGERYNKFVINSDVNYRKMFMYIPYILMSITAVAITNINLLKIVVTTFKAYITDNPSFKDKQSVEVIKEFMDKFQEKMNEQTIITRMFMGILL
ncbi:MAG: hypothetical protein RLZZ546_515, partial [Bacteroidota bacterium]